MKTRKTKAAKPNQANTDASESFLKADQNPVKLLLLPAHSSQQSRIYTLAQPATSKPCRYYICPEKGVYEFRRIAAPKRSCQSWLLGPRLVLQPEKTKIDVSTAHDEQSNEVDSQTVERSSCDHKAGSTNEVERSSHPMSEGYTVKEPELFVTTPLDPLFLILPSLHSQVNKGSKGLFLCLDDLVEAPCEVSRHFRYVIDSKHIRHAMGMRMAAVCDTVEAGDEMMYRLNMDKLIAELLAKAKRTISNGLPASMETKFVTKALEIPIASLMREESSISSSNVESVTGQETRSTTTTESQSSTATSETAVSALSTQTDITIPDQTSQPSIPKNIEYLLRLRTALTFILSSYLPPSLASSIKIALCTSSSPIDFTPLDTHLNHVATLRAEAQAFHSQSNFSLKRNMVDDEEAAEAKAEKRRKKEEEEKKQKAGLTKGIRDLKKVDVSGMRKMSDFFGKRGGGK